MKLPTKKTNAIKRSPSQEIVESVAVGYVALLFSQFFSRGISFASNLAVVRLADREAFGVAAMLQIFCSDIPITLSREGFRDACQRTPSECWSASKRRAQILKVAWYSWPISMVLGFLILRFPFLLGLEQSKYSNMKDFNLAAALYVLGTILEMFSEPLFILAQNLLLIRLRARAEMYSLIARVSTVLLFLKLNPASPLLAFAMGQVSSSVTSFTTFVGYFCLAPDVGWKETALILFGIADDGGVGVDWGLVRLTAIMAMKTVQKLLIEKGEALVLLRLFDAEAWAAYAVVQNLGSIVVRIVFLPVEELSQLAFCKLLSEGDRPRAKELLLMVLKLVGLVGGAAACLGPGYAYCVVRLLYGAKWSETGMPAVLGSYSVYLIFLALNGVTEAFAHASATPAQMTRRGFYLMPCTAIYLALAWFLAPSCGLHALIVGNGVNMALRIGLSLAHARRFYCSDKGLQADQGHKHDIAAGEGEASSPQMGEVAQEAAGLRLVEAMPVGAVLAVQVAGGLGALVVDWTLLGGRQRWLGLAEAPRGLPPSMGAVLCHFASGLACAAAWALALWRYDSDFLFSLRRWIRRDRPPKSD